MKCHEDNRAVSRLDLRGRGTIFDTLTGDVGKLSGLTKLTYLNVAGCATVMRLRFLPRSQVPAALPQPTSWGAAAVTLTVERPSQDGRGRRHSRALQLSRDLVAQPSRH